MKALALCLLVSLCLGQISSDTHHKDGLTHNTRVKVVTEVKDHNLASHVDVKTEKHPDVNELMIPIMPGAGQTEALHGGLKVSPATKTEIKKKGMKGRRPPKRRQFRRLKELQKRVNKINKKKIELISKNKAKGRKRLGQVRDLQTPPKSLHEMIEQILSSHKDGMGSSISTVHMKDQLIDLIGNERQKMKTKLTDEKCAVPKPKNKKLNKRPRFLRPRNRKQRQNNKKKINMQRKQMRMLKKGKGPVKDVLKKTVADVKKEIRKPGGKAGNTKVKLVFKPKALGKRKLGGRVRGRKRANRRNKNRRGRNRGPKKQIGAPKKLVKVEPPKDPVTVVKSIDETQPQHIPHTIV